MTDRINAPLAEQVEVVRGRIAELREMALEQAYMFAKTQQPHHLSWMNDYKRDIEMLEWALEGVPASYAADQMMKALS